MWWDTTELPGRCTNPKAKPWHACEGLTAEVRVRALFKICWSLNAAEMQKHRWEVQGQILITALRSLPKGEVAFTFSGFLLIMKSCPILAQALMLVKLFARLDSIGWSCPVHFACWVSFPLFVQLKSLWLGRRECMVGSTQLRAGGRTKLFFLRQQLLSVESAHHVPCSFTQSSRLTFDNSQLQWLF